ncbi:gliding motility-associated C-terminal domain-containing protein [Segetibacter koreensis]|uniref:T9SS type B sorting domain-containing protein n=1 Tax=Segetibacter koreensis TaxID=398037 RepID=UPI0012FCA47E|nr:gliding motility-associated C-terminal domain-containing protein [Segetibacter koreensis]
MKETFFAFLLLTYPVTFLVRACNNIFIEINRSCKEGVSNREDAFKVQLASHILSLCPVLKYLIIIFPVFSCELFAQNSPGDTDCVPAVTISVNQNDICANTAITFHAATKNEGTDGTYHWKKNNGNAVVTNTTYFTSADFKDGDVVVCEYSSKTKCGVDTTVRSNSITVHVVNDITPSITIANTDPLICEGELTVFTTQSTYGNATPSYQWIVNGQPVGNSTPDYSTDSLTNGSRVECILTISTPSCPGTSMSATSQMTIYVYPMIHPKIEITPSKTQICRGETVTFTATANGGTAPTFSWEINGKPIGEVSPSLVTSTLKDGDSVSCTITIDQDSRCRTSTSAPSNKIGIHVIDYPEPSLVIAAPILDICPGTPVTFTAFVQHPGDHNFYQWKVNGNDIGNDSPIFVNNEFRNGDEVSCILSTDIPGCPFPAKVASNAETVTVRDPPVITFLPPEISVAYGEVAQLHATVSGTVTSVAWTPTAALTAPQSLTSSTVPLTHDTVFNLTIVDNNGCTANKDLAVKVLNKLYMPSAFTPNTDGKNDVFRIPPGASISLREFSIFNRFGNIVFSTRNIADSWDGTYKGQHVDTGTYVYFIKGIVMDEKVTVKGTVTLIR